MPTNPDSPAQNYGGLRRMAGTDTDQDDSQSEQSSPGTEDPQKAMANAANVLRECESKIMSVAGDNPKVAKQARDVQQAISRLMAAIVSNPGGDEPPASRRGY